VFARRLGEDAQTDDSTTALLTYADGSTASLSYLANASPGWPKEQFEVHGSGMSARCENYRTTTLPDGSRVRGVNQDKGQAQALAETIEALKAGRPSPMRIETVVGVSRATQAILDSVRSGQSERVIPWQD
jgi:predicted dehydrogenase